MTQEIKQRPRRLSRLKISCIVVFIVLVVAFIWVFWPWIQPFPANDVPDFPFRHYGLQVERVVHCYNPPGFKGDGPVLTTYQLKDFDVNAWIQQANKRANSKSTYLDNKPWIRGPINNPRYLGAFEYALSREAVGDQADGYPWRKWVRSSNCYFSFIEMNRDQNTPEKWAYVDVCIWILDAKNKQMYLVGRYM